MLADSGSAQWSLPAQLPARGVPLGEAYDRQAASFREAGLMVFVPDLALRHSPLRDFVRHFHVSGGGLAADQCCMVFVATEPWDEERVRQFLQIWLPMVSDARLRRRVGRLRLEFRSAWPLPSALVYLCGGSPCAQLELQAQEALREAPLTPLSAGELAGQARRLLQRHLSLELSLDRLESVGVLNDIILDYLRGGVGRALSLEAGAYVPRATLTLLGVALGEVIRRSWPASALWVDSPEGLGASSLPALELLPSTTWRPRSCFVSPVDRAFQLYQSGWDRDLVTWYEAVVVEALEERAQEEGALLPVLKRAGWEARAEVCAAPLLAEGPRQQPLVVLARVSERRQSFVRPEELEEDPRGFTGRFQEAVENLAARSPQMSAALQPLREVDAPEVMCLRYGDLLNAARVLLGARLYAAASSRWPGCTSFWVAVPARDYLLVTPAGAAERLGRFQRVVHHFHERAPAPISSLCLSLGAAGLQSVHEAQG
jgi:hypothetical protein